MVKVVIPRINNVSVVGRLVDDAIRPGGTLITFRIAIPNRYRDKEGNWKEETTFINVQSGLTRMEDALKKGVAVYVEGSLRQSEWTDKEGNRRTTYYIRARKVQVLTREVENVEIVSEDED